MIDNFQNKIKVSRERAYGFLMSMMSKGGIFDTSDYNKGQEKGMFLAATYNAVNALSLINKQEDINKANIIDYIDKCKLPSGYYRLTGMKKKDLTYPDFEYNNLHITNYIMAARDYLGAGMELKDLRFTKKYRGRRLDKWLSQRDMSKPWTEGNYVVNVTSFLIKRYELGDTSVKNDIDKIIKWHYDNQDEYGFYHDTDICDLTAAFAGGTHNFHIFYYYNLPIAKYKTIIDYILSRSVNIDSACIDVDEMDVMFHFIKYGYRTEEIKKWVIEKADNILNFQNTDGGFADAAVGTGNRQFDGWKKYNEPQGLSNCFATWFRLIAIGMADIMINGNSSDWHFRRSIGIGYANPDYLKDGINENCLTKQEKNIEKRAAEKLEKKQNDPFYQNLSDDKVRDLYSILEGKLKKADKTAFNYNAVFTFVVKDEGAMHITITNGEAVIAYGVGEASDLTVGTTRKTLEKMLAKKLDPKVAYFTGKLKIMGNIGLALKLGGIL